MPSWYVPFSWVSRTVGGTGSRWLELGSTNTTLIVSAVTPVEVAPPLSSTVLPRLHARGAAADRGGVEAAVRPVARVVVAAARVVERGLRAHARGLHRRAGAVRALRWPRRPPPTRRPPASPPPPPVPPGPPPSSAARRRGTASSPSSSPRPADRPRAGYSIFPAILAARVHRVEAGQGGTRPAARRMRPGFRPGAKPGRRAAPRTVRPARRAIGDPGAGGGTR